MAEDSTRRLLRAFGIAATDCEEALAALTAALRDPAAGTTPAAALDAYGQAATRLAERWTEVSRLIVDFQTCAHTAVQVFMSRRTPSDPGRPRGPEDLSG